MKKFLFIPAEIYLANMSNAEICTFSGTLRVFLILGIALTILKILVPLILMIMGSLELGKAVIASDDKAISNAVSSLAKKVVAGIIIFFIPTIINFVFSLINGYSENKNKFQDCSTCLDDYDACQTLIDNAVNLGR